MYKKVRMQRKLLIILAIFLFIVMSAIIIKPLYLYDELGNSRSSILTSCFLVIVSGFCYLIYIENKQCSSMSSSSSCCNIGIKSVENSVS